MKKDNSTKLYILKNHQGQALRVLQSQSNHLNLVQNKDTRRLELVDSHFDYKKSHHLLHSISINDEESIPLKSYGSLSIQKGDEHSPLDPQLPTEKQDISLPVTMKWSSISHGVTLGILILFYLFLPQKKSEDKSLKAENMVTIQVDPPQKLETKKPDLIAAKTKEKRQPMPQERKQTVTVKPRIDKTKSLHVTQSGKNRTKNQNLSRNPRANSSKSPKNAPTSFQRMGTLGTLSNTLKGVRSGQGSGLRVSGQKGTGGRGKGAGTGVGNGTMGHGSDFGGGYEQALYGKGLIAGQVGGGGGSLGSGWGNGHRGSGSYGTKGKGGGHESYGSSRIGGSGSSTFSYPVSDEAMIEGGLDREAVILVVMKNLGQITYCYELGLQKKPELKGRVLVDFIINGKGQVASQSVSSSSLRSSQVEKCMLSKIKTWKFPRPAGGVNVEVSYPFALQRVSGSSQSLTAQ